MTRTPLLCLALLLAAAPLAAQRTEAEPRRPRLPAMADTTDAATYFSHGISILETQPRQAADAFYWASRLDPAWAEPLYARRIALHMSDSRRLELYLEGNRRTIESPAVRQIDSLQYRALTLNPFLYRKLDRPLFKFYMKSSYENHVRRRSGNTSRIDYAELDYWINDYLRGGGDPWMRAWGYYSSGSFPDALRLYASALKGSRQKSDIHADRARIFFMIGNADSAHTQMSLAVEQMRRKEKDDLVYFYESKALYEHSIGMIQERLGNTDAAREAYARALQEDLSYHPAHTRLAMLALADGDTATALGEMDLAVQIQEGDAVLRHVYGATLMAAGRLEEAVEQLRRAVALEPHYAAPYYTLGRVLEMHGDAAGAEEQYRAFLARASRSSPQVAGAQERLKALGEAP